MTTQSVQSAVGAPDLNPMLPQTFRVRKVINDTYDTFTLELTPSHGGAEVSFRPGQFNMLYLYGVGEVPISISGDPSRGNVLVHTTRAVGTVTKVMSKLKVGDLIGVRGPYGTAWPVEEAVGNDVVIIAGGIGLAPLRPALYHILSHRTKYGKVVLLYGTRTPSDILYRKDLEQLRSRFDLEVHVTVDRAMGTWRGNVGVVTNLIPKAPFDPTNTVAMVCGPEIMMRFTVLGLQKRGVALDSIYLSLERNMKCAVGFCGHCQFGPLFVCKDGPVFRYGQVREFLNKREI
ncbi:MAG: FAD/NAD(P)-binding protein [candidate division Zixibacteria bacterium]|nr:FAD/NAD(P)-binding protein [candidate division Zixibacteria bacterium]